MIRSSILASSDETAGGLRQKKAAVVSLTTLYPDDVQPFTGLFIRERLSRLARRRPLTVLAAAPWFPGQSLVRVWRRGFRRVGPVLQSDRVPPLFRPRFISVPGVLKRLDSFCMALCLLPWILWLRLRGRADIIDAHFAYPEGDAARLLSRWTGIPYAVTLRGTEVRHAGVPWIRQRLALTFRRARLVIAVSDSLLQLVYSVSPEITSRMVIGNGVDTQVFRRCDGQETREAVGISQSARILITVGGLVPRKGFHRVIEVLPEIRRKHGDVHYLIVGGASAEGDYSKDLRRQIAELDLQHCVHMLGPKPPTDLAPLLSASDLFVLATSNEGWANVLLEAMACGLPVVATDRGGNAQVISSEKLGLIVPFGDGDALRTAVELALSREWDRDAIVAHARRQDWESRIDLLDTAFGQAFEER
jgi:glycosyltransferase involved in cell wall biosynthesis